MGKLECGKCHYIFESVKKPKHCPYCSAEGTVGEIKSAQDFLDEVGEEVGFMDRERSQRRF